jgi:hypothetical protein
MAGEEGEDFGQRDNPESGMDPRQIMQAAARAYVAGMSIAARYWMEWAQLASGLATKYSGYPMSMFTGSPRGADSYGRWMDDYREYLRKLSEMPARAAKEYSLEVETIMREFWPKAASDRREGAGGGGYGGGPESPEPEGEAGGYGPSHVRRTRVKF